MVRRAWVRERELLGPRRICTNAKTYLLKRMMFSSTLDLPQQCEHQGIRRDALRWNRQLMIWLNGSVWIHLFCAIKTTSTQLAVKNAELAHNWQIGRGGTRRAQIRGQSSAAWELRSRYGIESAIKTRVPRSASAVTDRSNCFRLSKTLAVASVPCWRRW